MTSFVIDTHPLAWKEDSSEHKKLSTRIKKIFENLDHGKDNIYIPAPVVWELGNLFKTGKLKIKTHASFEQWFREVILSHPHIHFEETKLEDVLLASSLELNNDPFDRLIVATAIRMELALITKDERISKFKPCKTIW